MTRRLDRGFVAVHAGAGYHPLATRASTLRACEEACERARTILIEGNDDGGGDDSENLALKACVAATMALEDDPITNAGIGSNLTMDEKVECDAGLMEGRGMRFAGVGCVRNVKNPIAVCRKMLEMQTNRSNDRACGLVPPILLAGDGATAFARRFGLANANATDLVTKRSVVGFRRSLEKLAAAKEKNGIVDGRTSDIEAMDRGEMDESRNGGEITEESTSEREIDGQSKRRRATAEKSVDERKIDEDSTAGEPIDHESCDPPRKKFKGLLDTVGVIVVDNRGRVAASCSSGGPLLKLPGRVGHSAQFGCGAWAEEFRDHQSISSIAVGCTGCGEYLTRTQLAKTIAAGIANQASSSKSIDDDPEEFESVTDILLHSLRKDFMESRLLKNADDTRKVAGAIAVKTELVSADSNELLIDFGYGHRSSSMCLAHTVPGSGVDGATIRCLMSDSTDDSKIVAGGGLYRLKLRLDSK